MTESLAGDASAAPLSMRATAAVASAIVSAARQLLTELERGVASMPPFCATPWRRRSAPPMRPGVGLESRL